MYFKTLLLCAVVAVAAAGFIPAAYHAPVYVDHAPLAVATPTLHLATPTAVVSQSSNVVRGPFGSSHLAESHSSLDTPFSSERRSDVRVGGGHALLGVAYSAAPQVSHVVFDSAIEHYVF